MLLCVGLDVLAGLAESALSEENGDWDLADPPPLDLNPRTSAARPPSAPGLPSYSQAPQQAHDYDDASYDQQAQGRFPAQPQSCVQLQNPAAGQLLGQVYSQPQSGQQQRQGTGAHGQFQAPSQHPGQIQAKPSGQAHAQNQRQAHSESHRQQLQSQQPQHFQTQAPYQHRFQTDQAQGHAMAQAQRSEAQLPSQLHLQLQPALASDGIIRPQAVRSQGFTMHRGHQPSPAGQLQPLPALPSSSLGSSGPQTLSLGQPNPYASSNIGQSHPQAAGLGLQHPQPASLGSSDPSSSALGPQPSVMAHSPKSDKPQPSTGASSADAQQGQAGTGPGGSGVPSSVPAHLLQPGHSGTQYPSLGALPKVLFFLG